MNDKHNMHAEMKDDRWAPEPECYPVSIHEMEMRARTAGDCFSMDLPMADPCPECGAFRLRVGDFACWGHCYPCFLIKEAEQKALDDTVKMMPPVLPPPGQSTCPTWGCRACGEMGMHACTGAPVVWTEDDIKRLDTALNKVFADKAERSVIPEVAEAYEQIVRQEDQQFQAEIAQAMKNEGR